ncbi:MAG: hypothetical protein Udaeo2_30450 [Candidatus Udaeobacter sp.]|nr:MAG: hypothetical protein Udaeo2_30450 [Candidatus Udaeobacter sp.]
MFSIFRELAFYFHECGVVIVGQARSLNLPTLDSPDTPAVPNNVSFQSTRNGVERVGGAAENLWLSVFRLCQRRSRRKRLVSRPI